MLVDLARASRPEDVGGKAFNLYRLARRGVPTPGGFVVPATVFLRHLERAGVLSLTDRLLDHLDLAAEDGVRETGGIIRDRIISTALDDRLIEALERVLARKPPGTALVVRSSAAGEDGAGASFAGLLDSFLGLNTLAELECAIKATWSSAFSPRVLNYAIHRGPTLRRVGVIVQSQVDALYAGVLFTRGPRESDRDRFVFEYAPGLGDKVVNGAVTPSFLAAPRDDSRALLEVLSRNLAPVDARLVDAFGRLAKIGLDLESPHGVAQDIEWCVDTSGAIVVVQARPISTSIAPKMAGVHWTNANIAENYPNPVTPFLFSIVKPGYSAYFRNLGRRFGLGRKTVDAAEKDLDGIVGLQGGRLYYNLTNIHRLLIMMPAGDRLVDYFDLFVGSANGEPRATDRRSAARDRVRIARIAVSIAWQYLFIGRRLRAFEKAVDAFAARTHPARLSMASAEEAAMCLREFLHIRMERWHGAALSDAAAMVCYGLLKSLVARHLPGESAAAHNDLFKGLSDLASAEAVSRLWGLSRTIRSDPDLFAAFARVQSLEDLQRDLTAPEFASFRATFDDYLERWGFRASGELMLTEPTSHEDARPVLRTLRRYLASDSSGPIEVAAAREWERKAATKRIAARLAEHRGVVAGLPLPGLRSRFRVLLWAAHGAIRLRERARMKQALLYTRLRHVALRLGEHLVQRGLLSSRDDVFYLEVDEVLRTVSAEGLVLDLAPRIRCRRESIERARTLMPPDDIVLAEGEQWTACADAMASPIEPSAGSTLRGVGACGGSADGIAAVVESVAHADRVKAGDILVTCQTDPGWATVFFLVKGLVIERGGMLSHGAIIAREYGIPAVVGVSGATRLIREGQRLLIDGDRGVVEIRDA